MRNPLTTTSHSTARHPFSATMPLPKRAVSCNLFAPTPSPFLLPERPGCASVCHPSPLHVRARPCACACACVCVYVCRLSSISPLAGTRASSPVPACNLRTRTQKHIQVAGGRLPARTRHQEIVSGRGNTHRREFETTPILSGGDVTLAGV